MEPNIALYALASHNWSKQAIETQRNEDGIDVHIVDSIQEVPRDGILFLDYNGDRKKFKWFKKNLMIEAYRLLGSDLVPTNSPTCMIVLVRKGDWVHLKEDVRQVVHMFLRFSHDRRHGINQPRLPWGGFPKKSREAFTWLGMWDAASPHWNMKPIKNRHTRRTRIIRDSVSDCRVVPAISDNSRW